MEKEFVGRFATFLILSGLLAAGFALISTGMTGQTLAVYLAIFCGFYAPLALLGGLVLAILYLTTKA